MNGVAFFNVPFYDFAFGNPFTDIEAIVATTEKTGRVVVVQEAQRQAGVGARVMAEITERAVLSLEAPVGFVAAPDTIFPFGQAEHDWLPNATDIEEKVREVYNF